MISTGLLEYFTGLVILKFFNRRLWDYNVEILNFGNIRDKVSINIEYSDDGIETAIITLTEKYIVH